MRTKYLAILGILFIVASCKKESPPATQTTATTATTATPATETLTTAPEPPKPLDHFKFWKVKPGEYQETLWLFGQADRDFWEAKIGNIQYLGNPVAKERRDDPRQSAGINGKVHYIVYTLEAKTQPLRRVELSNQFTRGRVAWRIEQPKWLLTPAGKTFDGSPELPRGDHFVCYDVTEGKPFPTNTVLKDQFDERRYKDEQIRELQPKYFCIPVQKRRKTEREKELVDAHTHLAIYLLNPKEDRDQWPNAPPVQTIDQFKRRPLTPLYSDWLGVPTVKHGKPMEIPPVQ